jgi:hypothetical protein
MGSSQLRAEDLGLSDVTVACPDLSKFSRLDELGLVVTSRRELLRRLRQSSLPGYRASSVRSGALSQRTV